MEYDVLIVGAGISGLYATREILKRHPTWRVALCEKYKILGGRTSTFHKNGWQWEAGAGRIHSKLHPMVMRLLKEYGLTFVPISDKIGWKEDRDASIVPNPFESEIVPHFLKPLSYLAPSELAHNTLDSVCKKVYGSATTKNIFEPFPYRSEVSVMRADMALDGFLRGEMKGHEGYGVVAEGFSALVDALHKDCLERGAHILNYHKLLSFKSGSGSDGTSDGTTDMLFRHGSKKEGYQTVNLCATRFALLTLCRCHIAELPQFKGHPLLKHVSGQPLLRIYMVFPKVKGHVWFEGLGRVVTAEKPRYILPIDEKKGIIMASYTDSDDTKTYHTILEKGGEKELEKALLADLRALFPEKDIPKPVFTKAHDWGTGASYWTPGSYDPKVLSKQACKPFKEHPNVYMCGESWSLRQAWVEGALEHTKECLRQLPL